RPPGPAGRHDQLPADRPGFIRCQEHREVGNLRGIHHATDGVAAWGIGGKVTLLCFLWGNAQLSSAGGEQPWGAFGASRAWVDTVDGNPVAGQLYRQSLSHMYHGTVTRPAAEIAGVTGVGAADVDDAAPTLLFQVGNNSAGAA